MLDANKGQPTLLHERQAADEPSAAEMFTYAIGVVRRQILLVSLLATAGAVLGVVSFGKSPPKFTAAATLLVDTRKIEIFQQPAVSTEMSIQSTGAMESQVALLKSDEIALAVIKKLNLSEDPRFLGTGRPGTLTTILRKVAPFIFPEQLRLTEAERLQLAVKIFEQSLTAERVGVTYAIEINFEAKDPGLAAEVANAVADAYIDEQRASEYDAARRASDWLEVRIPELRAKSEAAQRAVVEYKSAHDIVETSTGQLINDQRVTELSTKLNAARDDTLKAKARLDQLTAINGTEVPSSVAVEPNEKTTDGGILDKLRSQYIEVVSKEAEYSVKYGPNNPAIIGLRKQKEELQFEIKEEVQRLKEGSKNNYAVTQLGEAAVKKEFDAAVAQAQEASHAQVKLRELEASARAYQDLYNTYINRYNASLQQAASPVAEANLITPASPLIKKDTKKALKVAALFPVAGIAFGLGIALIRELFGSRVFRTSKSVQSRLRIPCIGLLSKVEEGKRSRRGTKQPQGGAALRSIVRGDRGICWTVVDYPFSRFSEGVRSIKLAIDLENKSRSTRVIGFTSSNPSEGKSTVALTVGQLIARNGANVIVVDCDLRNPSLTRSVAPDAAKGLVELVMGEAALESIIWKDRSTQLAFLPAVPRPGPPDPPSILSSTPLKRLFDELRKQYEYIIVDLSPLAPVVDVCATAELVDAYVLVIEWGRTTVDVVQHALRAAPDVRESLIGAVLNKANIKELATYDPYLTAYYFDKGGRNYGYSHS